VRGYQARVAERDGARALPPLCLIESDALSSTGSASASASMTRVLFSTCQSWRAASSRHVPALAGSVLSSNA
jgi:hypothetical protein